MDTLTQRARKILEENRKIGHQAGRMQDPEPPHGQRVSQSQWAEGWRDLASMTSGIQETDPRFKGILNALVSCDRAFEAGDWGRFVWSKKAVREVLEDKTQKG